MKTAALENPNLAVSRNRVVADLAELVKARLTLLVLLTTAVGFYLGSESPINYMALFHVVFGTAAAAGGAAALNQWWERTADALMRRTRMRPIPAGRMRPLHSAKARQHCEHRGRRNSGRNPTDDRLGGCARKYRRGGMESVCDSFFVAVAAFLRHRLDVPRRLFAGGFPHDFER